MRPTERLTALAGRQRPGEGLHAPPGNGKRYLPLKKNSPRHFYAIPLRSPQDSAFARRHTLGSALTSRLTELKSALPLTERARHGF